MRYYQSGGDPSKSPSELLIEWTNQHGCGTNDAKNPNKLNCDVVAQFTCGEHLRDGTDLNNLQFTVPRAGLVTFLDSCGKYIDGLMEYFYETEWLIEMNVLFLSIDWICIWNRESLSTINGRRNQATNPNQNKGLHETWDDYNRCATREANRGLYLGKKSNTEKKLKGNEVSYGHCYVLVNHHIWAYQKKIIRYFEYGSHIGVYRHLIFSRVLRDSTPRFVRWSVGRSPFYFFYVFVVFGLTAPVQML